MTLYPLRFEPIFKSMLWGGRRLPAFLNRRPPHDDPVGEAWVLSDVDGSPSLVADGPLAGTTLRELLARDPRASSAAPPPPHGKFPLLAEVHRRTAGTLGAGPPQRRAGREARARASSARPKRGWSSTLTPRRAASTPASREGVTADHFRAALADEVHAANAPQLHARSPGDCVFLEAGTVHAIGANILLFEVQQTSDITYRLYDWDRVDAKTGKPRQLHIDDGLACADFRRGPCQPVGTRIEEAEGVRREGLVNCRYFSLERKTSRVPFRVGAAGECRAVVCIGGAGEIEWGGKRYPIATGDTVLLPAEVGECVCRPEREIIVLECGLPV